VFHALVVTASLRSPTFKEFCDKQLPRASEPVRDALDAVVDDKIKMLSSLLTSVSKLNFSESDVDALVPVIRTRGNTGESNENSISSIVGIGKSLYYDKLFAEQTDEQWRGMMKGFAWRTVFG
jgi:hypothetical protein